MGRFPTKLYGITALLVVLLSSILVSERSLESYLEETFEEAACSMNQTGCKNDRDEKFNYTAFWRDATIAAQASLASDRKNATSTQCPKVYVYDLPWDSIDSKKHPNKFGNPVKLTNANDRKKFQGYLFKTNQYSFPSILEHRLRQSGMCRTLNPFKADLFYAPVLSRPKGNGEWNATCQRITGKMIRKKLVYLNSSNACRHFFAIGKGHTDVTLCDGWFSNPIRELKPFLRLAYSSYSFVVDSDGRHFYDENDTTSSTYPNLYSVPYPSSLHFYANKTCPHFSDKFKRRPSLMSFIGKDNHGDTLVRRRIHSMCDKYADIQVCDYQERFDLNKNPTDKSKAIFCLEPAGDTPTRKSIADSITFGCIPVLFSELTDNVAPWFWLDWKDRARVLVPRSDFVAGRIDLKKLLESIPQELLNLMQRTLKDKARHFQYSIDDDPEDGIRITLDNLNRVAKDMEHRGVCGYEF